MKQKNVQISYECYMLLLKYFVLSEHFEFTNNQYIEWHGKIKTMIHEKFQAMVRREVFSKYKNSAIGTDEREQARKEYINLAGIDEDWQSKKEFFDWEEFNNFIDSHSGNK